METILGRQSLDLDLNGLHARLNNYERLILDLGTGDGKFAFRYAQAFPHHFAIGIDACRENLHEYSRAKLPNLLYVIANAAALPDELHGLCSHIAINFPWGSLLEGLLVGEPSLMCGLTSIARTGTTMDICLNGGALSEAGMDLESGASQMADKMREVGWQVTHPQVMESCELQEFPSTWAKRLAYGRDPWAVQIHAQK